MDELKELRKLIEEKWKKGWKSKKAAENAQSDSAEKEIVEE